MIFYRWLLFPSLPWIYGMAMLLSLYPEASKEFSVVENLQAVSTVNSRSKECLMRFRRRRVMRRRGYVGRRPVRLRRRRSYRSRRTSSVRPIRIGFRRSA